MKKLPQSKSSAYWANQLAVGKFSVAAGHVPILVRILLCRRRSSNHLLLARTAGLVWAAVSATLHALERTHSLKVWPGCASGSWTLGRGFGLILGAAIFEKSRLIGDVMCAFRAQISICV